MKASTALADQVIRRAGERCEYCRMHQALQGAAFHIEHIIPESRGGVTDSMNLALACPTCNLCKSDRTEAIDPETNAVAPMFHPRRDSWTEHFEWDAYEVRGKTAVGRATLAALDFNHRRKVLIRQAEESFGLFPP